MALVPMGAAADVSCLRTNSADSSSLPTPAVPGPRAYDPCFGCATHTMPGQRPMIVTIRDKDGVALEELRRD